MLRPLTFITYFLYANTMNMDSFLFLYMFLTYSVFNHVPRLFSNAFFVFLFVTLFFPIPFLGVFYTYLYSLMVYLKILVLTFNLRMWILFDRFSQFWSDIMNFRLFCVINTCYCYSVCLFYIDLFIPHISYYYAVLL